ncbi:unnamed protein product [Caenorhabditis brenneri]
MNAFPTGTYSINGRNYRNTFYRPKRQTWADGSGQSEIKFEDIPDVYEKEPYIGCYNKPDFPAVKNIGRERTRNESKDDILEETEDTRIQLINKKKWFAKVFVPKCFIGKLIGTNRRTLNALENDTQCRIKTPRGGERFPCEISSIVSLECVQRCLDRIDIFIADARKSARVTHFVAFPCDQHEVKENFNTFKQLVIENERVDESCKNPQLFTKSSHLHLTLAVVRIFDDMDLEKTINAFKTIEQEIRVLIGSSSLLAKLQGIDMMNDDPTQVSVIYANVSGVLIQNVANHISRRLIEFGIASSEKNSSDCFEEVKLHMTLMNARYSTQSDKSVKRKQTLTFDATTILEEHRDFYFGSIPLSEICLCPLGSSSSNPEEFYDKIARIKLV